MRLFLVYSTGNFIEATAETCYLQIGESKYGKPVLDRMLVPSTPLAQAAKVALVSIDSTLKSNLLGGAADRPRGLRDERPAEQRDGLHRRGEPYFTMIRNSWGQRLREDRGSPTTRPGRTAARCPFPVPSRRYEVLTKIVNPTRSWSDQRDRRALSGAVQQVLLALRHEGGELRLVGLAMSASGGRRRSRRWSPGARRADRAWRTPIRGGRGAGRAMARPVCTGSNRARSRTVTWMPWQRRPA